MITKIFPYTLMTLDVAAAIVYFWYGNLRLGTYWFAAAVLTACVTL